MNRSYQDRLRADDWVVRPTTCDVARPFIETHHYARGASNTAVHVFGLFPLALPDLLAGVTWWLPPTRVAAESVDRERWQRVLALSRMVVHPRVAKNACTFMLARAVREIQRERKWAALVTYADESQGHEGRVYRAAGWDYVGRTGPYLRWVDPRTGRQVASQATTTRTVAEMAALGYVRDGRYYKHKFVKRLAPPCSRRYV